MKYLVVNSLSNNKQIATILEDARNEIRTEFIEKDVKDIEYLSFLKQLSAEDEVVIVGGDGTINYFINAIGDYEVKNNIYLYAAGTGNDFMHDVADGAKMILLNPYLKNLPTVEVNGMKKKFINVIGYGIDGYCCEVGDKLRETTTKEINYTSIAIKGLLFHFKKVQAKVVVDGETYEFKNVWLAPSMKGRYYGGGMMIAPAQNRLDPSGKVSVVIYKTCSKMKALIVFPSIFKGQHVKHQKMVKIFTGKEIEVTFNHPTALQIDGETVLNVLSYKVHA